jgi:hypothetical protein
MSPKRCPHCNKKVPLRRRFQKRCPSCFQLFRRHSGLPDRPLIGQYLEDRSATFWFFILVVIFAITAMIMQLNGKPDLLNFMDKRPVWFALSVAFLAMYAQMIGHIYLPLLIGAPKILRRERALIRTYKKFTTAGLIMGIPFVLLFTGTRDVWVMFPATIFLFVVPLSLMWAFQALTLTDDDYEDQRNWSFFQELGAPSRLEHRHYAYFVLVGLPICGLIFWYFITHPWLAHMIQESEESGLIRMLSDAYHRIHTFQAK